LKGAQFASKARHHLLDHKRDCHTNKAYTFNIPSQKQTKTKRKKQLDLILLQKQGTLDIQANKVLMKPLTNPSNCKKQPKQAEFPSNNRLQNSTWVPDWHTDWQAGSVGDAARHCSSLSLSLSFSGFLQSSTGQRKREDDGRALQTRKWGLFVPLLGLGFLAGEGWGGYFILMITAGSCS